MAFEIQQGRLYHHCSIFNALLTSLPRIGQRPLLSAYCLIYYRRGGTPGPAPYPLLRSLGFPLRRTFDVSAVAAALRTDKMRDRNVQRWILPMAVGRVEEVSDVTPNELNLAIEAIRAA